MTRAGGWLPDARQALDQGDLGAVIAITDGALAAAPGDPRALDLRRVAFGRMGEISEQLRTIVLLRASADTPARERAELAARGRLVETSRGWLPRIAGPSHPIEPASPNLVLHLLKESLPYRQTGFTLRSRYNLLAQMAAGLEPVVVTQLGFPRSCGVTDVPRQEVLDGIVHHRLDLGPDYPADPPHDVFLVDGAALAADVVREVRPAFLSASSGHRGYEQALIGLALREHFRIPLVYEVRSFFEGTWTADPALAERSEQYARRAATELRCMLAADAVITVGDAMRAEIIGRGVSAERVFLVPNGVDPADFDAVRPNPELRRRLGLLGRRVFGYISSIDHYREDHEVLIAATAILATTHPDVACLIVGDGQRRPALEALARQLGVADRVVFTGRVPHAEVRDLYALLDVFAVPRRDERAARMVTPLKPFEAMATGLPLVVADLPALTEIAPDGERGLVFPPSDAAGLAAVLARLMDDPALRRRLGQAGRAWVRSERTWTANGPRYRNAYEAAGRVFTARAAVASGAAGGGREEMGAGDG